MRQKKRVNRFRDKKVFVNSFATKKCALIVFGQKSVRKSFSRLTRNSPDHPETTLTIRKLSRYPETFQVIRKLSRYPETFQAIWKLSRLFGNFRHHLENIQAIRKLSRLSRKLFGPYGKYQDRDSIRKLSRLSGNFPGYPKTF